MHEYLSKGILLRNPFSTLDQSGVGFLVELPALYRPTF